MNSYLFSIPSRFLITSAETRQFTPSKRKMYASSFVLLVSCSSRPRDGKTVTRIRLSWFIEMQRYLPTCRLGLGTDLHCHAPLSPTPRQGSVVINEGGKTRAKTAPHPTAFPAQQRTISLHGARRRVRTV